MHLFGEKGVALIGSWALAASCITATQSRVVFMKKASYCVNGMMYRYSSLESVFLLFFITKPCQFLGWWTPRLGLKQPSAVAAGAEVNTFTGPFEQSLSETRLVRAHLRERCQIDIFDLHSALSPSPLRIAILLDRHPAGLLFCSPLFLSSVGVVDCGSESLSALFFLSLSCGRPWLRGTTNFAFQPGPAILLLHLT